MTAILSAKNIFKSYGPVNVLADVSMMLEECEAHVVIGPNGAGKTTLFKCLSGETTINSGTIELEGKDVTRMPGWRRIHKGVGRSFQVAKIFPEMTTYENLIVAVEARERVSGGLMRNLFSIAPPKEVLAEVDGLVKELGLEAAASEPSATLSHGDKKRLELAMALALRPRLLMLDEPTAGMSPSDRANAVSQIARLRDRYRLTLLLTEHDMEVVFGLATRLTVLHHGEIIADGDPATVRADPHVREVYLGHA